MDLKTAFDIVDICTHIGIKHITLIGGEPTLYPYLTDVIKNIHSKKIKCGFVSNGLKFDDESYVKELIDCGIKHFSVSLKGEDREIFKKVTGEDAFEKVVKGIENCINNNANVSVSMVLTEDNIESYIRGIEKMKSIGVDNFHLSFCYEFNPYSNPAIHNNPKRIIKSFIKNYPVLDRITQHKFSLSQSYPMCIWDKNFIAKLESRGQITSICQLLNKSGLIFDTQANIIPCNAMHELKLGQLYKDFNNAEELLRYVSKNDFKKVYDKLCGIPDVSCLTCSDLKRCAGGCVCQWTNYSFKELLSMTE